MKLRAGSPLKPLVALLWGAGLGGCGLSARVAPVDERPALVIARFERVLSAGTESRRTPVGAQITETDGDGRFTLSPPLSLPLGKLNTDVIVSKPGFQIGRMVMEGSQGEITLSPSARFEDERLAVWTIAAEAERGCRELDETQCTLLRGHLAEREAYLAETYPKELTAAAPPALGALVFDGAALRAAGQTPLGAAQLADGRLAVLTREKAGRSLSLYRDGALLKTLPLADPGGFGLPAALGLGDGLSLYDQAAVRRLVDDTLQPLPLSPAPEAVDAVAALLDGPEGPILGVLVGGARAELWRYGPDGARRSVTPLPGLRAIWSLTPGPDGEVLVVGPAEGGAVYGARVDGLFPVDPMPRAALWAPADGGAARPVAGGFDLAVPAEGGYWAVWLNLIPPNDEPTARAGFPQPVARHFARRCDAADVCGPLGPSRGRR
ncbi:MAG: hypothetical protein IPN01_04605 [Deltaproteobacteria bacterium]|nr:hypothetical protein [Deltaproteobacteria bacterium]